MVHWLIKDGKHVGGGCQLSNNQESEVARTTVEYVLPSRHVLYSKEWHLILITYCPISPGIYLSVLSLRLSNLVSRLLVDLLLNNLNPFAIILNNTSYISYIKQLKKD